MAIHRRIIKMIKRDLEEQILNKKVDPLKEKESLFKIFRLSKEKINEIYKNWKAEVSRGIKHE